MTAQAIKFCRKGAGAENIVYSTNPRVHSTPKESIHFEFRWVSTQNLHHVGHMRGYGG